MTQSLRLLLVEDNEDDALLVLRQLRADGFDVVHRRVDTSATMQAALAEAPWDVVISDYSMPTFSGPAALALLKASGHDIPFIMMSGTVEEETAVASLHAGAHDFLVKSRLARLAPAILREMKDAESRRAQRAAEEDVKRLEEQVRHAQKMDAIGRLAGGVAHDFNNILTAIIATADLALATTGLEPELRTDLESIRDSGHRAAAITRQLLTFSRKQVTQPRALDLNDLVLAAEPLLRRLVPAEIDFRLDLRAEGIIQADPTQVEQLVLNLVVNAADATPAGGFIEVATSDFSPHAASQAQGRTLLPGAYVVLRVRDSGHGMDRDTQARIFEPFFTTKAPGRGTGLGLATVYGIVNQSDGQVFVHSQPGAGATFEIFLPRLANVPGDVPRTSGEYPSLAGSEVIMVVEDDASVRAPICRALRQYGYFVIEADNGESALRALQEYHAPVHVLVSDIMMPEMKGTELVRLLHDWYPALRVLFISGYSEELVTSQAELSNTVAYMAKPFTPSQLIRRIRELLDVGPAPGARAPGAGSGASTPRPH